MGVFRYLLSLWPHAPFPATHRKPTEMARQLKLVVHGDTVLEEDGMLGERERLRLVFVGETPADFWEIWRFWRVWGCLGGVIVVRESYDRVGRYEWVFWHRSFLMLLSRSIGFECFSFCLAMVSSIEKESKRSNAHY